MPDERSQEDRQRDSDAHPNKAPKKPGPQPIEKPGYAWGNTTDDTGSQSGGSEGGGGGPP